MTRFERLLTLSAATCCACNHSLSIQELNEFYGMTDAHLHADVYCRTCIGEHLALCHECSGRYTTEHLCDECTASRYAPAG